MAADSCETVPADKSDAGYTLTAAYAASPPAVDEIAFTMETENLLALTYGGDLMQYKPLPSGTPGIYVAAMNAPGNEGVIGRWVDKWEGSEDFKTWTFHIRPGIKSWAGNEMTAADIVWTWQRALRDEGGARLLRQRDVPGQARRYRGHRQVHAAVPPAASRRRSSSS